jgi:UDP-3-O-[3-hydroxymyristoyl] N-acetylglucosamine deacetylase/3-hydroxyacyl-[acyl-carrier-protein] dehydratase
MKKIPEIRFPEFSGEWVEKKLGEVGILVMSKLDDPQNYLTFFAKIDKVRFRNKVHPGDTIIFKCSLIGPFRRGICHMQGLAYANGKLCAEAELTAQITKVK